MKDNHGHATETRDEVALLLRLAGRRPAVPGDRAKRVREAARAVWRQEVARRNRRRMLWTGAGLAAAASLLLAVTFRILSVGPVLPPAEGVTVVVESLAGPAWGRDTSGGAASPRPLGVGDDIGLGFEVLTADTGRAALRLASGHSVRLDASTRIRLLDAGSLALDRGAVYVDSGAGTAGTDSLAIHTPLGVVHEIGTQFEVRLEGDAVRVRLREGAVVVRRDDRVHEVAVGTEIALHADGSVVRGEIAPYGPAWDWIAGVTPVPDLEGQSARAFLDWVARERGWTLAFADESLERSAGEIVLGGALDRLTIDEALDAVLPTCRMTYRVERGVLRIAAMEEAVPTA